MVNFISLVTVFLIICEFKNLECFEWVALQINDSLPSYAVKLDSNTYGEIKYVGRTQYLNTLQLVEVHYDSYRYTVTKAVVRLYSSEIVRDQFEVLVAREHCEWVLFDKPPVPENIVRGGTSWNLEPVFVGRDIQNDLVSIFLTSNKQISSGKLIETSTYALVCDNNHKWIDATSSNVPENSVSIGENDGYVARVVGSLFHVPGTVFPKSNETFVWYNGNFLESFRIQVLVDDDSKKYSWKTVEMGSGIPEYAVVCGISDNNELTYISKKYNRSTGTKVYPISFSEANDGPFEILVENVN